MFLRFLLFLVVTLFFIGCTPSEISRSFRIATAEAPLEALEQYGMKKALHYALNPKAFQRDMHRFRKLLKVFRKDVRRKWGRKERKLPTPTRYVKYFHHYDSRVLIDFKKGVMTVETLREKKLEKLIVAALLTPDDPRRVDLFSSRATETGGKPFLSGEVLNQKGEAIESLRQAQDFARYLRKKSYGIRTITVQKRKKSLYYVKVPLVRNNFTLRVNRYTPIMKKYAWKYRVDPRLVYAITKVESNFNPYAVSPTGAYGLMQLIPTTGGRDAFRKVYGYDAIPTRTFLFQPENNISLGTAYIALLQQNYLKGIHNPLNREYCSIAAYNAGAGTVLRLFHRNKHTALKIINRMKPSAVYYALHNKLKRAETRRYISKVLQAKLDAVH